MSIESLFGIGGPIIFSIGGLGATGLKDAKMEALYKRISELRNRKECFAFQEDDYAAGWWGLFAITKAEKAELDALRDTPNALSAPGIGESK